LAAILEIPLSRHGVTAIPPLAKFFLRKFNRSIIRSHSPQHPAGNALAIAGQNTIISELQVMNNQPIKAGNETD